uniref:Uncharacterized protein n=1 Tax=Ditylenchus dipsaci TaxID=166011 RepID=A0A915D476_9BILA
MGATPPRGLDIWDAVSGECIYPNVDNFWYPEGIEVAVAKGFLIAYSHCRGGYVYKVDRDSCIKLFDWMIIASTVWRIISINSYNAVLITSVGAVFVLDYLSDINHSIRFERTRSGELSKCCCYLPLSDVLVGITENTFVCNTSPKWSNFQDGSLSYACLLCYFLKL